MVSRIATVPYAETRRLWPLGAEAMSYRVGDLLGMTENGYAALFDQRQPLRFLGVSEEQVQVPPGAAPGQYRVCVDRPMLLSVRMNNASPHHVGYKAYAHSRDQVQLQPGAFGNFAGVIVAVLNPAEVLLAPPQRSRADASGVRILPGDQDQVLGRFALYQTIFVPNTAPITVTLPPLSATQPGDILRFVKTTPNAYAVTLQAAPGDSIEGLGNFVLSAFASHVVLVSSGDLWLVLTHRAG
ncbi:MAG: hypothetical protein RMJ19_02030 [Gemmatales bacterium]|nr:hypothetical protein [Gemmatales bacterium]MCS7159225.1 hypothetical protein [Gemmatales bacterium]MDW8174425.1 hypothetical protein [Gemmatales bacterium]MDW8222268.1 hypothetical protein [Gemmatales bacterium]